MRYQKITLDTKVINGILTEYKGQTCKQICENNYYGQLSINSYTLYGNVYTISLNKMSDGLFKIGTGPNGDIMMSIKPTNGGNFSDYTCGADCGKPEFNGNIINFSMPGTFSVDVYEMCGNEKSDNISNYTININDTKRLEMIINGVPLKYMVGENEDLIPYNKWFYDSGNTITSIADDSLKGWFGVHNPKTYSNLFQNPLVGGNKLTWTLDINSSSPIDIISNKLQFMFDLSNGAYVTAEKNNSFNVRLTGASGNLLLRSAMPEYDKFSEFNTEKNEGFNLYLTNEKSTATCNRCNPNIVSENYRFVTDNETKFPSGGSGVNSEDGIISGLYNFNPKYSGATNAAGNHFAGFSNNANIVQTSANGCEQRTDYDPYQVIPYKAHDLYKNLEENDKMCVNGEKSRVLKEVYTSTNDNKRYFRTEFIDRRFDYNMLFITGHRGIHFDISNYESDIINPTTKWDKGRISATTYNGIEMLFGVGDNGNKLIVSDGDNTEYQYDVSTAEISLNLDNDKPKRFYESKLYYGDGYVDLTNAFYHNGNADAKAFYNTNVGEKVELKRENGMRISPCEDIRGDNCYNYFNLKITGNNGSIEGYPTKRILNYCGIPYGDKYSFKNVSCSYNIEVTSTNEAVIANAVPGEEVTFDIEAGELIKMQCGSFYTDCGSNHYNVRYNGVTSGTLKARTIKDLSFSIDSVGSPGFRSKVENLGVRVLKDDSSHSMLDTLKKSSCITGAVSTINSYTKWSDNSNSGVFDTSDTFKNHVFKVTNVGWDGDSFITMFFDRLYYSQAADSLMKRIRVFNVSTIYNVSSFGFSYEEWKIWKKDYMIPPEAIEVESSGQGEIQPSQSGQETDDDENESNDSNNSGGESFDVTTEGKNTNEVPVENTCDWTVFKISSAFLRETLADICFKITFGSETFYYYLSNGGVKKRVENGDMFFDVIWTQHTGKLSDGGTAEVIVYIDIKNEIKAKIGEGHMEFAFGFTIAGTNVSIVQEIDPQ